MLGNGAGYPPQAGNVTSASPYSTTQQGPNTYGTNFTPPGYGSGGGQQQPQPQSGTSSNGKGSGPASGPNANPQGAGFSNEREIYGNGASKEGQTPSNLSSNMSQSKDSSQMSSSTTGKPMPMPTPPGYYSQNNASLLQGYGGASQPSNAQSNYGQAQDQQQQYAQYMQYSNPNLMPPQQMPPPGMGQAGNGGSMHHNNNSGGYKLGI